MRTLPLALLLAVFHAETRSQSVVAPNAYANTRGTGSVTTLLTTSGRTWMLGIAASELAAIPPGSVINGLSFRPGSTTVAWPPANGTFANYDITVGYAIPLATWTGTFANNFTNTPLPPVAVRAGPLVIEAGRFIGNATAPQPNPWGDFYWDFQKTFPYVGGDIGILFTHTGSNVGSAIGLDYVTVPQTVAWFATGYQVATGATLHIANVSRVHYGYGAGCPGSNNMTPNLVQTRDVAGGGTVTFGLANAPAGGTALYVVGASATSVPLPNGCTVLATPTIVLPATLSGHGRNALTTSFPPGLALRAYVQAFVIDAGAPGGYSATNGVTLTVTP